jgi:hypothetical protein
VIGALLLAALVQDPEWGSLTLPPGFAPASNLPMEGSGAAAPSRNEVPKHLSAIFVESTGDGGIGEPAVVAVSVVEEPLPPEGAERELLFSETAAHFHQSLAIDAHVDRPVTHGDRVELSAEVDRPQGSQIVRLAFFPAGTRHFVLWASSPAVRAASLATQFDAIFDSYRPPNGSAPAPNVPRPVLGLVAVAVAGLVLVAVRRLWRRTR